METNDQYVYGFKGFDKYLRCRGYQFEIGETYYHEGGINDIKICRKGFHFCTNLNDVFNHYSLNGLHSFLSDNVNKSNRFCIVKAKHHLGIEYNQSDKNVTDEITIVEEIPIEIIKEYKEYLEKIKEDPEYNFRLDHVKIIQQVYPHFILGGSTALYLHGFNIQRKGEIKDLDFVTPYYTPVNIKDFNPEDGVTEAENMSEAQPSGNDFDYVEGLTIDGSFLLLDMKIDPKQRFVIINHNGFDYKVSLWHPIIEAKMRYANVNRDQKHKKDLIDMFQLNRPSERKLINPIDSILNKFKQ